MALLGFSIVLIHLLVGFGFLIYKLAPKAKKVIVEKNHHESIEKQITNIHS